jgi:3-deoxy-D-manno-octulosonic-acid transferase
VSALGAYALATGGLEALCTPLAAAARRAGGARAERFGFGDARGATWIHAASVGEVAAAAPLVRALLANRPGEELLVSATTPGGLDAWRRELERRTAGGAPVAVAAWPLDFPGVVRRALAARRPRRLLVLETELWPNALAGALAGGVRVAFANARLSAGRWPWTRRLVRPLVYPLLKGVAACAAQTDGDAARWAELGVPREALAVTGNTKYDALPRPADEASRAAARAALGMPVAERAWVWGSVRPGEEAALAAAAAQVASAGVALTLVAAPRHPERAPAIRVALTARGVHVDTWQPGERWPTPAAQRTGPRVVLVPVLGILRALWAAADVATVGGTFVALGGHNVAEPAALGLPTLVGPHVDQVREAVDALVGQGGGRVCRDGREAAAGALELVADPGALDAARAGARRAIENLAGASARTLGYLEARGFWG